MKKIIYLIVCLLTFAVPMDGKADDNVQAFPPDNKDACNADTALMWDGKNSVRCESVIRALPEIGQPVFVKSFKIYGANIYNDVIGRGMASVYGKYPDAMSYWEHTCKVSSGSDSTIHTALSNPGCLNFLCIQMTGTWPVLKDNNGSCTDGSASCGGKFAAAFSCFNADKPKTISITSVSEIP